MYSLLKQLKLKQEAWYKKTPKQKWQTVYNGVDNLYRLIGVRFFSDMKNYWYSYTSVLLMMIYVLLMIYTYHFYSKRGNYIKGLECTCGASVVTIVSLTKTINFNNSDFLK